MSYTISPRTAPPTPSAPPASAPPDGSARQVAVRCRPLSSKEVDGGKQRIVDMDTKTGQVIVRNPKSESEPPKTYTFDVVYDWNTLQLNLYQETASPIVDSVTEGYNGTIFAYGQTGTGKTHTMEGSIEGENKGIIPNTFDHIFRHINTTEDQEFLVRASFLEIYNEEIRDLLGKNPQAKLKLKENVDTGVYVKGLTAFVVKGVAEINNVLKVGKKNRTVGATLMNQDSSRSHSIFTVVIESCAKGADGDNHIRVGKLNLVDLAGSERQSKTGATGDRLKEATKINLSLSALGNVIQSLVDGKSGHIPYRDSRLTRLLQDSLGGNTKTVMIANIGPADYNFDETLSTLRYANRAKNIKNKPRINEDPKDAMLREFQDEIKQLRAQIEAQKETGGVVTVEKVVEKKLSEEQISRMKLQIEEDLKENITDILSPTKVLEVKRQAEMKAQEEVQRIKEENKKIAAERESLEAEARRKQEEAEEHKRQVEAERASREALAAKLKAMESKLLHGEAAGVDLVDQTKQQEAELLRKQRELADRKQKEQEQLRRIQELEGQAEALEETYASKQEEASQKTRKLKKLFSKYQAVKSEIQDMTEDFQSEKEELLDTVRLLSQQLKIKELVVESFIPGEDVKKIMHRAEWDEDAEAWQLRARPRETSTSSTMKRPMSAAGVRRPTSEFAKMASAMGDNNPRFKSENILSLELDLPERTTVDYEGAVINHKVQAAMNSAFMSDDAEILVVNNNLSKVYLANDGTIDASRAQLRPPSQNSGQRGSARRPASARRRTAK